jgi:hypothetical protein
VGVWSLTSGHETRSLSDSNDNEGKTPSGSPQYFASSRSTRDWVPHCRGWHDMTPPVSQPFWYYCNPIRFPRHSFRIGPTQVHA